MRPDRGAFRVLVIDDDPDIRDLVRVLLEGEGYEVATAEDGEAALALLPEARPDLIMLDMRMPGLGGPDFARRYRALPGRRAPLVAFTAAHDAAEPAAAINADGYIAKPFAIDELLEVVRRHIAKD